MVLIICCEFSFIGGEISNKSGENNGLLNKTAVSGLIYQSLVILFLNTKEGFDLTFSIFNSRKRQR